MTRKILLAAALALAIAPDALADDGWYPNETDCTGAVDATPALLPGKVASWCPSTTTTQIVKVHSIADCNWYTTGGETLSIDQCSGSSSTYCTTPLVDADGVAWVVTSADDSGRFSLASGVYEITASAAASTGRLLCTGR